MIEGEPSESFPEQLRFIPKQIVNDDGTITEELIEVEPLAADIRGRDLKEMSNKLKTEILRLLAPYWDAIMMTLSSGIGKGLLKEW